MPTPRRDDWTDREAETLRKMKMQEIPETLISERLGRSRKSVNSKWKSMRREERLATAEAAD